MREIKFRAWNIEEKRMFEVEPVWFEENFCYDLDFAKCMSEKGCVIMQYTGLHDKNGKEICEGDILHYYWKSTLSSSQKPVDQIFEVVFGEGSFQQMEIYREDLQYRKDVAIWHDWADLEIIGNLYENPELINQVN